MRRVQRKSSAGAQVGRRRVRRPPVFVWLLIAAAATLGACNFTGYEIAPEPSPTDSVTHSATDNETPAPVTAHCPDPAVTELLLSGDYAAAQRRLNEHLAVVTEEIQRACILSSMGLLAALPASNYLDLQRAQDYQSLARVNGSVQRASPPLQLLDLTLATLIELQQRVAIDQQEVERLQKELASKERALKKLKALTLGR